MVSVRVPLALKTLKVSSNPSSIVVSVTLAVPVRPVVPARTPNETLPSSTAALVPCFELALMTELLSVNPLTANPRIGKLSKSWSCIQLNDGFRVLFK